MAVGAARGFKAGMRGRQTVAELTAAGLSERLIWPPASRSKALCFHQHLEPVPGGAQMLFASQRDIGLHSGTEGIHMTVGVFEGQHVVAFGEGIEVGVVFEVLLGNVAIESLAAALIGEKEVFGQSVGFVPGVGRISVWAGTLFLA